MSTFIFAPSWVKYDQPLKQEAKDEFPTLISHPNNKIIHEKQKQHSVWSNSHLIQQKIHHPMDDGMRQELELDKRYQLEKLKALVPKIATKKATSSRRHKASVRSSYPIQRKKSTTPTHPINPSLPLKSKEHTNIEINATTTTTTLSTTTTHTKEETSPESFTSQKELQKFIHFLKYWTSTRITPHVDNHHEEYSYFSNTSSPISSSKDGSDLDDQTADMNNCSLFQYDPFPLQ